MATYQITINEKDTLGKTLIALLQSVPNVVSFNLSLNKEDKKSEQYHRLDRSLAEVRLMIDGKKKKKTAMEFLDEIRNKNENRDNNNK
ncbi:MAG: hypothetical protein FWH18_07530 [Marinilabiliaceae bacterium]|nr:hypothetical protein [Marinilabiliaceae bacterium]